MASGGRGLDQPGRDSGPAALIGAGHEQGRRGPWSNTVFYLLLCFMLAKALPQKPPLAAHRHQPFGFSPAASAAGGLVHHRHRFLFLSIFVLSSGLSSSSTIMIFSAHIFMRSLNPWGMRRAKAIFFPRSDRQPGYHLPNRPGHNADLRHDFDRLLLLQQPIRATIQIRQYVMVAI